MENNLSIDLKNNSGDNIYLLPETHKIFNDITIYDIKSAKINLLYKEVLIARYSEKPIKELDANFAGEKLKQSINRTILESGFKTQEIPQLIIMVISDIFRDFSYMTISEVAIAFRMGVREEFGEIMGISVRTFYTWLRRYNDRIKSEANKLLLSLKKEEKKEISDAQILEHKIKWLKSVIEDFRNYKSGTKTPIYDFGHLFYNYCIKHGIGYLTSEEKKELYEKAKITVLNNHKIETAKSSFQLKEFREVVSSILNDNISKETSDLIKSEAKKLSIHKFYDKIIENNFSLSDLINTIENINISTKA